LKNSYDCVQYRDRYRDYRTKLKLKVELEKVKALKKKRKQKQKKKINFKEEKTKQIK
jgi:hypothetical protein